MPDLNDYHAFKSTTGGSDSGNPGGGGGCGCGTIVIIIFACLLIFFIFRGSSWEAIECLLFWAILIFAVGKFLYG